MPDSSAVTRLLQQASDGQADAVDQLYPLVYDELRRLAQSYLERERPDHTLPATALVNEAYLKLVDQTRVKWKNRSHFFAVAAQAIRRILIDYARQRGRQKRGGDAVRLDLDDIMNLPDGSPSTDIVALDEALTRLAEHDPVKARVVEMRFFGGLTTEETAQVLAVTGRTVERYWQYARAWLYRALAGDGDASSPAS